MPEDRTSSVLARITHHPQLARVVPLLPPEVLHAMVTHYGLHDCGELLALATPEQLSAVFDLDLWRAAHAGGDEQFDTARFCEWLETLVDVGSEIAAAKLASLDVTLVVAGLLPNIKVFDPAVLSPDDERGIHAEIGGYVVVARRTDWWDAIVDLLIALAEQHRDSFQRVMRTCRRLTNSGWERDGLDNLLLDRQQAGFDLSVNREQRRDRQGFLAPEQARAFLDVARTRALAADSSRADPLFVAYQRSLVTTNDAERRPAAVSAGAADQPADLTSATADVLDALRSDGVLVDAPRALLLSGPAGPSPINPAFTRYLQLFVDTDERWNSRIEELGFLSNALMAGCSVQGRSFTRREAGDAVAATCNLGLDFWPMDWTAAETHDLITIFRAGWSILHRDVLMAVAGQLLAALDQIRTSDRDLQLELTALKRQLRSQTEAGTPWQARTRLDALATFDLPAWAALTALLAECPVMLANVSARGDSSVHTVNPSEFRFIARVADIVSVHGFLVSLPELLTG
jgi:hypothetical protein